MAQSKMTVKNLEASKTEPEKKLLLYKNMIGDIKFWDRCIDEIQQLKGAVNNLETQMANSGNVILIIYFNINDFLLMININNLIISIISIYNY